jgi:dTDP-4-amino-4,6-dideoxy-D-glucose acyltransferase
MKSPANLFIDLNELAHLDSTAIVGRTVRIRKPARVRIHAGSIIDDFTYISCGLTVGCFTHIGANAAIIGGDAQIDIGNFVNIAPGCRLIAASNDFTGGGLAGPAIPSDYAASSITDNITIADHVLLGTNVAVLPGTKLPEGLAAGACTLLTPDIKLEPWTVYVGIPARPIKARASQKILAAADRVKRDYPDAFH